MKNNIKLTTEEFIKKAKLIHSDKYDYSKVNYINVNTKVEIICPIHGSFWQRPSDHLYKKAGCNKCRRRHGVGVPHIHNQKLLREYRIWAGIKTRTRNPNTNDADRYINRGITCCDEWLNSFDVFYADMGPCPEGYSIDRIDNNKGYYKENCRWANAFMQAANRGDFNKTFTHSGETLCVKEWARKLNINYTTLYLRLFRSNLSFEDAIKQDPFNNQIKFNDQSHTLSEWCKIYNIKYQTVVNRIHKHKWDVIRAITTPKCI